MDLDDILFELKQEVTRVKKMKYLFIDSPFLNEMKEEPGVKAEKKNKILVECILRLVSCLLVFILFIFFMNKFLHGQIFLIVAGLVFLLAFFVAIISITKSLTHFSKLSGFKTFDKLRKNVIYDAFNKKLNKHNFSTDQIEKYILPHLKDKNNDRREASITTFLKIIIPSILVSMIVSGFTLIINTAVEEPSLKEGEFNQVLGLWLILGIEVIVFGAFLYTGIHYAQKILSSNKNYKLLEKLFYSYLLEKNLNTSQNKKAKKSKKRK
ncbi:hypothetical protein [Bacillus altitudinis]|uniref:hypothetical protein n=1 Tax=Bacillus altitudinis TaxID=293387 RepID=UPI00174DF08D|nr:hypothetical protein [Bacillus altitudinis]NQW96403.1 hypothetical protein [Bacillus stratosphericus]QSI43377.1 hypothetical protein I4W80_12750 [Bacillus altitudinis]